MSVPRLFIKVTEYGLADDKGKTLMGIGLSGKRIIARPDAPLATMVALLELIVHSLRYSSPEAAEKDYTRLREFAASLEVESPAEKALPQTEGVPG